MAGHFGGISLRKCMKFGLVSYNDPLHSGQVKCFPEIFLGILPFDRKGETLHLPGQVFVVPCVALGQVEASKLNKQDNM